MQGTNPDLRWVRKDLTKTFALAGLVVIFALVLIGPSGLWAWSQNNSRLAERQKELGQLVTERNELKNRVSLLDPSHVDPDMAGELLRSNLNVVHPDEKVMLLK